MGRHQQQMLNKDAEFVLRTCKDDDISVKTILLRRQLNDALKALASSTSTDSYGIRFDIDVRECGLSQYACSIHGALKEFIIVDNKRPHGPTAEEAEQLPDIYDAQKVIDALKRASFSARLLQPQQTSPPPPTLAKKETLSSQDYARILRTGVTWPAVIFVEGETPFTISLPNPITLLLLDHFRAGFNSRALRSLVSLVNVWAISWGVDEDLRPMTLSLMILRFLYDMKVDEVEKEKRRLAASSKDEKPGQASTSKLPSQPDVGRPISKPATTKQHLGTVHLQQSYCTPQNEWISMPLNIFLPAYHHRPDVLDATKHPGSLFARFLTYFSTNRGQRSQTEIISIPPTKREMFYHFPHQPISKKQLQKSYLPPDPQSSTSMQPFKWQFDCLVVTDPFVGVYNHASNITAGSLANFYALCKTSSSALAPNSNSTPPKALLDVFGPKYLPLIEESESTYFNFMGLNAPEQMKPCSSSQTPSAGNEPLQRPPPTTEKKSDDHLLALLDGLSAHSSSVKQGDGRQEARPQQQQQQRFGGRLLQQAFSQAQVQGRMASSQASVPQVPLPSTSSAPARSGFTPLHSNQVETIQRIQSAISKHFGSKYKVELFGSARYGIANPGSDLDLVIIDPARMTGFAPEVKLEKLPDIYDVRNLARIFRKAGFEKVYSIPSASVPIVKFKDGITSLECDINVNDQLGLINSDLLRCYCDIQPEIVRPMIKMVKRWARPLGLNDPSGGRDAGRRGRRWGGGGPTFSSYALMLMVVAFLQHRGILPSLQKGFRPLPSDEKHTEGVFWVRTKQGDRIRCDTRYRHHVPVVNKTSHRPEDLLFDWFKYWGSEFDYVNMAVCVKQGGVFPKPKGKGKGKGKKDEEDSPSESQWRQRQREKLSREENATASSTTSASTLASTPAPAPVPLPWTSTSTDTFLPANLVNPPGDQEPNAVIIDLSDDDDSEYEILEEEEDLEEGDVEEIVVEGGDNDIPEEQFDLEDDSLTLSGRANAMCVIDPFIRAKNVTGNITNVNISRFKGECQRAVRMIRSGASMEDLSPPDGVDSESENEDVSGPGRARRGRKKKNKGGKSDGDNNAKGKEKEGSQGNRNGREQGRDGPGRVRGRGQRGSSTVASATGGQRGGQGSAQGGGRRQRRGERQD